MAKRISYLYVAMAVLLWSPTAAVGKLLLRNLNNLQFLFFASLIATASLFVIVLFQKKLPVIREYGPGDYWRFAYMGFIGVFLYYVLFFAGLALVPAQEAFIVNYTWPVWLVILAMPILKEEFNHRKLAAILLGFMGVYVVVTRGSPFSPSITDLEGNLLALAGAVSYGIFSALDKKHNYERLTSTMFYYAFAFLYVSVSVLLFSEIPSLSLYELASLAYFGIFACGLAFVFWFLALKHGDTARMSNIVFLTPFLSLIPIYFLVGERILPSSVIGLVLIVAGIVIQSRGKK
ncbi:MAG: DMT family transporter [Candidatus Altiarchaeota archaeon]|nr:DMT family transporter [Candidatus Altiarchaeota archaeon]MBU4341470.1 DMT family transporter [Candidatus Altiarchaeota archaeon]